MPADRMALGGHLMSRFISSPIAVSLLTVVLGACAGDPLVPGAASDALLANVGRPWLTAPVQIGTTRLDLAAEPRTVVLQAAEIYARARGLPVIDFRTRVATSLSGPRPAAPPPGASVGALLGFTTAGAVACLWNLHRCVSATQNQLDACLDQECPGASHVDVEDCTDIGLQDFKDCEFSCGADMPDADEEDACVRAFKPGPLPAPGPGGFTPPGGPDGGLFGECNGANADACDARDTVYTDSNGDIVDVDCTFYTLDDPTRSDDCYCQCSEIRTVSSEVEFLPE